MKGQNCKGIQSVKYNGPEICAVLTVIDHENGNPDAVGRKRTIKVSGRLNNPRKNEQAVLTEICAKVKREHPTAKLVSFKREEGRV